MLTNEQLIKFYNDYNGIEEYHTEIFSTWPIDNHDAFPRSSDNIREGARVTSSVSNRIRFHIQTLKDQEDIALADETMLMTLRGLKASMNSTKQRRASDRLMDFVETHIDLNPDCLTMLDIERAIDKVKGGVCVDGRPLECGYLYISPSNLEFVRKTFGKKKNLKVLDNIRHGYLCNPYLRGNFAAIITNYEPLRCYEFESGRVEIIGDTPQDMKAVATESYEMVIPHSNCIIPIMV